MRSRTRIVAALLSVLACLGLIHPAIACQDWVVQGIIDWSLWPYLSSNDTGVYQIESPGWRWDATDGSKPLEFYTANDSDIFTPRADQIDALIPFRILAGGTLVKTCPPDLEVNIDWYRIYSWEDTNNDGKADVGDKEQDWKMLFHRSPYSEEDPSKEDPIKINEAFDLIQRYEEGKEDTEWEHIGVSLNLQAGKTYLLLLYVWASDKTNLQFEGTVTVATWPYLDIVKWDDYGEQGWQQTGDKRFTDNWSPGVDDYEVLWIRVNNPPAKPLIP